MSYVDPATVQATDPGDPLSAAWCDTVRDDLEFLVDPPACSISGSVNQSVTTNTYTALLGGLEGYDTDSMHSLVSNTSRITIQTAGRYLCVATTAFASNTTGNRSTEIWVNGANPAATGTGGLTILNPGSNPAAHSTVRVIDLDVADYVETVVIQRSGGNLDVTLVEFVVLYQTR